MKDKDAIITIGDVPPEDVEMAKHAEGQAAYAASEDAARAVHEGASDIEVKRLSRTEAGYADRFVAAVQAALGKVTTVARRIRAARSARATRRAKPKAPKVDDGPERVYAEIGALRYAEDPRPFLAVLAEIIADALLKEPVT